MTDPYDPEAFRAAGHPVIDQLADYLTETGRGAGPVLSALRRPLQPALR